MGAPTGSAGDTNAGDTNAGDSHAGDSHAGDSHAGDSHAGDSHVDELPAELDASGYRGPYRFPDNSRRRIPGVLYLATAAVCAALWLAQGDGGVLVNDGFVWAAVALGLLGAYQLAAGWRLEVRETDALVAASQRVGFAVGHASAQLAWRGLRSRPTWRVLLYSSEDPPAQRGLVLVDGLDGEVVAWFVEDNPEDWTEPASAR